MAAEKQLIVVSLPEDKYYKKSRDDIAQFVKDLAAAASDKDDVLVLFPSKFMSSDGSYGGFDFGDAYVLPVDESIDLWMRDFGLVSPYKPVKFIYGSDYLSRSDARYVDNSFRKLLSRYGGFPKESRLILDGGNVVDNGVDKAIITDRFYYDNPKQDETVLRKEVEAALDMTVAIIPDPRDTTGHADGVVSFIDTNVLAIGDYCDAKYYKLVKEAVEEIFPDLTIVKVPCMDDGKSKPTKSPNWRGFSSSVGSYVNSLLTDSTVYVPQFNKADNDQIALDIVQKNTHRRVVTVDTSRLSHMGGSVRCMSWQISSSDPLAKALLKAAKQSK
ncbi:putative agmatine deiminase isoform X2 [Rhopilema esculentum]|eukprot:gene13300-4142_t